MLSNTPTGIDRVEMAYAQHLDRNYSGRTRYLVSLGGVPQVMPSAVAVSFLRATRAIWNEAQDASSAEVAGKLSRFLALPDGLLADGDSRIGARPATSVRRKLAGAAMLVQSALSRLRPAAMTGCATERNRTVYLNVSHQSIDNPQLLRWLKGGGAHAAAFLLHDLIPITNPEYVRANAPDRHVQRVRTMVQSASSVIVNSNYTSAVLRDYLDEHNQSVGEIVTAPLGVEEAFLSRARARVDVPPYFVCVGTIEPRKNHLMLLQVWRRMIAEMGEAAPKLVLIGRKGWENGGAINLIERGRDLQNHVIACSGVSDKVLARLVTHARATLFPSHVEGYGLPVAESLALGTPVICSDIDATREVGGDLVERLDSLDGAAWLRAIAEYAAPESVRQQTHRELLSHYTAPRWDDHLLVFDGIVAGIFADRRIAPQSRPAWRLPEPLDRLRELHGRSL
jgi:glycosyltransferase involved in cell wall biosynthesis